MSDRCGSTPWRDTRPVTFHVLRERVRFRGGSTLGRAKFELVVFLLLGGPRGPLASSHSPKRYKWGKTERWQQGTERSFGGGSDISLLLSPCHDSKRDVLDLRVLLLRGVPLNAFQSSGQRWNVGHHGYCAILVAFCGSNTIGPLGLCDSDRCVMSEPTVKTS